MINGLNSSNGELLKRPSSLKTPELVATLLKSGGKILIVGGGTSELPNNITNHPQILIWDDTKQGIEQKEVPSNVKIIMYNRWISHTNRWRLDSAAKSLRAIKFPMLKTREIKELLSEFIQAEPMDITKEKMDEVVLDIVVKDEFDEEKVSEPIVSEPSEPIVNETEVGLDMSNLKKTSKSSPLRDFIVKNLNINNDYSVKGSISKEAKRLFPLAKEKGATQSINSLNQGISHILIEIKKNKGIIIEPRTRGVALSSRVKEDPKTNNDDFEQLDVLIQDAIAAMKLVQEHLPKVRKETERLRSMKDKVLKLFGE